jgi:YbgC/YbaW family acyl-CoA thioester hydrolase
MKSVPADFRYFDRLRVRWAEVDMQKIVFNGHYLMYFDTAVAGYWRALALPYHGTMELLQGDLYVRKATLEYHGSAQYDDQLQVGLRCARIGNSSIVFEGGVPPRRDQLLVQRRAGLCLRRPGDACAAEAGAGGLRELLEGFEAGQGMLDVRTGTWDTLGREAAALRRAVFGHEQGIALPLDGDAGDVQALHAVAFNRLGMPLGTGRLLEAGDGASRVGRMAVRADLRASGIGRALLQALEGAARQRGDRSSRAGRPGRRRGLLLARRLCGHRPAIRCGRHRPCGDVSTPGRLTAARRSRVGVRTPRPPSFPAPSTRRPRVACRRAGGRRGGRRRSPATGRRPAGACTTPLASPRRSAGWRSRTAPSRHRLQRAVQASLTKGRALDAGQLVDVGADHLGLAPQAM